MQPDRADDGVVGGRGRMGEGRWVGVGKGPWGCKMGARRAEIQSGVKGSQELGPFPSPCNL